MDLPPQATNAAFERDFKRGAVLLTELRFPDGESKQKFIIVLNNDPTDPRTLLFLTTSQVAFFEKHPYVDHIKIGMNKLPFFPRQTIIDCREAWELSRDDLMRRYREGVLKFIGNLPAEMIGRIDVIVAASRTIPKRRMKMILGWK